MIGSARRRGKIEKTTHHLIDHIVAWVSCDFDIAAAYSLLDAFARLRFSWICVQIKDECASLPKSLERKVLFNLIFQS